MTKGQFVLLTSALTLVLCAPIWPKATTRSELSHLSFQDLRSPGHHLFRPHRSARASLARAIPVPTARTMVQDKTRQPDVEGPTRPDPAQSLRSRLAKAVAGLKPASAMAAERQTGLAKPVQQATRKSKLQPHARSTAAKPTTKKTGTSPTSPSRTG